MMFRNIYFEHELYARQSLRCRLHKGSKSSTATCTMEAGCSFCLFGPIAPLEWEEKAPGARAEKGLTLRKGKYPLGTSSSIVTVETCLLPSANSEALAL